MAFTLLPKWKVVLIVSAPFFRVWYSVPVKYKTPIHSTSGCMPRAHVLELKCFVVYDINNRHNDIGIIFFYSGKYWLKPSYKINMRGFFSLKLLFIKNRLCINPYKTSVHFMEDQPLALNKNSNIQGRSHNVVKVIILTIRNCS